MGWGGVWGGEGGRQRKMGLKFGRNWRWRHKHWQVLHAPRAQLLLPRVGCEEEEYGDARNQSPTDWVDLEQSKAVLGRGGVEDERGDGKGGGSRANSVDSLPQPSPLCRPTSEDSRSVPVPPRTSAPSRRRPGNEGRRPIRTLVMSHLDQ